MNRSEWILTGLSGEAEAEPPEFLGRPDGKPPAYRGPEELIGGSCLRNVFVTNPIDAFPNL